MSQTTHFQEQGYSVHRAFLSASEVTELNNQVNRIIEILVPNLPAAEVYYENKSDPGSLKQIQQLNKYDEYFQKLATSDKFQGLAEQLLGAPVSLKNVQYFNKAPGVSKATPAHQDGYYFMIKPQQALTMWLSLGSADAENGAVVYLPKSHQRGLRPHHQTGTLGFSQGVSDWSAKDQDIEQQMHASAGDLLVHHSLTIHRANPNTGQSSRKAIGLIYYRADVEVDESRYQDYKLRLEAELSTQNKI